MVVLMSAGSVSAGTGGTSAPALAGWATGLKAVASVANPTEGTLGQILRSTLRAVNAVQSTDSRLDLSASLLSAIWLSSINSVILGGNDDNQGGNNNDQGQNNNNQNQNGDPAPAPIPEPSTLLSFGAALLIGGGFLLFRRLRKDRR
jgi:hypothetical protein